MATYYRRDEWVTDAQGNAISGAQVYVCSQPANTGSIPPSPEQQVYADPNGVTPLTQPILTDGYGHAYYYVLPGTYTVVYYSPQIQQVTLLDQTITSPGTSVSIPVTVAQGGTGATTAPGARTNLGAAASGANVDITSLGDISNTLINSAGYFYGSGTFASGGPCVQIADQAWAGFGVTDFGLGITGDGGQATLITPSGLFTSNTVSANTIDALSSLHAITLSVGGAGSGSITAFSPNQTLQLGGEGISTQPVSVQIESGQISITSGIGLLGFDANYATQSTVGAAGSASSLPANPLIYLQAQVYVSGIPTTVVIPCYRKS